MTDRPGPGEDPDSASAENLETLREGSMIGEFEIIGVIGEGGFGTVYLATDHSLQRRVALKEYRPAALATRQGHAVVVRSQRHSEAFEAGLRSFLNEARTLARFDHPSLVRVYRVWQENSTAYMAMALCEGRPLTAIVRDHPEEVNEAWLRGVLGPLLEAVETLHGVEIFHRDIAPDNIIIQENGAPVLLDFGAARQIASGVTQALTVILKPGYAPIEQFADDPSMKQGPWTDIYALGAVLYFSINGKAPPNSVARLVNDPLKGLADSLPAEYSSGFRNAIQAALAVRPDDRLKSIPELRARLGLPAYTPAVRPGMRPAVGGTGGGATTVTMMGATKPKPVRRVVDEQSTVLMPRKTVAAPPAKPVRGAAVSSAEITAAPSPSTVAPMTIAPLQPKHDAASGNAMRKTPLVISAVAVVVAGIAVAVMLRNQAPPNSAASPPAAATAPSAAPAAQPSPVISPASTGAETKAAGTPSAPAPPTIPTTATSAPAAQPSAPVAAGATPGSATTAANGAAPAAPGNGTINIAVKPWGEVIVDGENKGVSPPLRKITVPEGKHRVEVNNPGFPSYSAEVEVAKNKSITVSYQFK